MDEYEALFPPGMLRDMRNGAKPEPYRPPKMRYASTLLTSVLKASKPQPPPSSSSSSRPKPPPSHTLDHFDDWFEEEVKQQQQPPPPHKSAWEPFEKKKRMNALPLSPPSSPVLVSKKGEEKQFQQPIYDADCTAACVRVYFAILAPLVQRAIQMPASRVARSGKGSVVSLADVKLAISLMQQ